MLWVVSELAQTDFPPGEPASAPRAQGPKRPLALADDNWGPWKGIGLAGEELDSLLRTNQPSEPRAQENLPHVSRQQELQESITRQWQQFPVKCVQTCSMRGQQCCFSAYHPEAFSAHSYTGYHRCRQHWGSETTPDLMDPASSSNQ